jgi:large subunit ribosomal protein L6
VGKLPISKPKDVTVTVLDQLVTVKGPKGTLQRSVSPNVALKVDEQAVHILRNDESRQSRSLHGLTRALVFNMVHGVSAGFFRTLEIAGTGYRAEVQGSVLNLSLGFSHPVPFLLPEGIKASVEKTTVIRLEGIDKELLGQTAARIRALRPVEPYKGKGVRFSDEYVHRKAGKTGSKK